MALLDPPLLLPSIRILILFFLRVPCKALVSSSLSKVVNRLISWRVWSIWKASLRFSARRFPSPALLYTPANFVIRVLLASYLRATSTFNTRFVLLFYLIELLPPLLAFFFFSSFFPSFFFIFQLHPFRGPSLYRDS